MLVEIESPVQEHILDNLDNQAISEIVEELDSDDAADLGAICRKSVQKRSLKRLTMMYLRYWKSFSPFRQIRLAASWPWSLLP